MVAGGFVVRGSRVTEINSEIAKMREDAGIRSEFHWKDYRGGARREAYEGLVKYAFDMVQTGKAHFHVAIAQFRGQDSQKHARVSKDTRINKIYYQLLVHRIARFYGDSAAIHGLFDSGNDCSEIVGKRNQVCAEAYRRYNTKPNCIRTLEPMDSLNSGLIQMADVIVGGIASIRNGRSSTSPKGELAKFIQDASGHGNWARNTRFGAKKLTVWNIEER